MAAIETAGACGDGEALPDPASVAAAVEAALLALHGGTTKDYKGRYRTLQVRTGEGREPCLCEAVGEF